MIAFRVITLLKKVLCLYKRICTLCEFKSCSYYSVMVSCSYNFVSRYFPLVHLYYFLKTQLQYLFRCLFNYYTAKQVEKSEYK